MKKPFENTGNSPMYVGSVMIPPGEIRVVDVPDEPDHGTNAAAEPTLAEQVALLLKGKTGAIVEDLGELNADALAMMAALENQATKPRKALLLALADAQIALADAKLQSDDLDA